MEAENHDSRPTVSTPRIEPFFHASSCTYSYVAADSESACCAVIDPVLDFDIGAARSGHRLCC